VVFAAFLLPTDRRRGYCSGGMAAGAKVMPPGGRFKGYDIPPIDFGWHLRLSKAKQTGVGGNGRFRVVLRLSLCQSGAALGEPFEFRFSVSRSNVLAPGSRGRTLLCWDPYHVGGKSRGKTVTSLLRPLPGPSRAVFIEVSAIAIDLPFRVFPHAKLFYQLTNKG